MSRSGVYTLIYFMFAALCFFRLQERPGFTCGFSPPSLYSADVIEKWMTLEIRIYKDATGIGNGAFARPFAYSGISAYESIDPGLLSWKHKYNGLSGLPETDPFKKYNWPASVNASLAEFNRSFFLRLIWMPPTWLLLIRSKTPSIWDLVVKKLMSSTVPSLSENRLPTPFLHGPWPMAIFKIMRCPIPLL